MFKQDKKSFFKSKTNYAGLFLMGLGAYALIYAKIPPELAVTVVMNGVGFLGVKDAISKVSK